MASWLPRLSLGDACSNLHWRLLRTKPVGSMAPGAHDLTELAEGSAVGLARVLTTVDLVSLGVGSCVGTGMYVVAGLVAKAMAGPGVILSFLIAAAASILSGVCYAEFGVRVPKTTGSAYTYSYVTVGECVAFFIGWNLILEYLIGTAAGASALSSMFDSLANHSISGLHRHTPGHPSWTGPRRGDLSRPAGALHRPPGHRRHRLRRPELGGPQQRPERGQPAGLGLHDAGRALLRLCRHLGGRRVPALRLVGGDAGRGHLLLRFHRLRHHRHHRRGGQEPQQLHPLRHHRLAGHLPHRLPDGERDPHPHGSLPADRRLRPSDGNVCGPRVLVGEVRGGGGLRRRAQRLPAGLPVPDAQGDPGHGPGRLLFRGLSHVSAFTHTPTVACAVSGSLAALLALLVSLRDLIEMMSIGTLLAYTLVSVCVLLLRYQPDQDAEAAPSEVGTAAAGNGQNQMGDAEEEGWSYQAGVTEEEEEEERAGPPSLLEKLLGGRYSELRLRLGMPSTAEQPTAASGRLVTHCTVLLFLMSFLLWSTVIFGVEQGTGAAAVFSGLAAALMLASMVKLLVLILQQPQSGRRLAYMAPCVPFVPAAAILVNSYLMLKLSPLTWARFTVWCLIGLLIYGCYGMWHSTLELDALETQAHASSYQRYDDQLDDAFSDDHSRPPHQDEPTYRGWSAPEEGGCGYQQQD
ncbi:unnamed protein product, partial [Tetraodon nigroviridis]